MATRGFWKTPLAAAIFSCAISLFIVWVGFLRVVPTRAEVRTIVLDMTDEKWFEKSIDENTLAIQNLTTEVHNLAILIAKMPSAKNSTGEE